MIHVPEKSLVIDIADFRVKRYDGVIDEVNPDMQGDQESESYYLLTDDNGDTVTVSILVGFVPLHKNEDYDRILKIWNYNVKPELRAEASK